MSAAEPALPFAAEPGVAGLGEVVQGVAEQLIDRTNLAAAVVGVGVDAVDLERFRRVVARRDGLVARLFTPGERSYAEAATDPIPRMSTRFAAKEATMKALGVGLGAFPFIDVEVVRHGLGAPSLVLHRMALRLAEAAGAVGWHLSLTHTDQVAVAMVVAVGETRRGGVPVSSGPKP